MATQEQNSIKRYRRAHFWDYSKGASLFLTISTERNSAIFAVRPNADGRTAHNPATESGDGRTVYPPATESGDGRTVYPHTTESGDGRTVFGQIKNGQMVLNELGLIVSNAIESITAFNPGIKVFGHVVMPDHVHLNVNLVPGLADPLKVLGKAIARFKNFTIKQSKLLAEHNSAIFTAPCSETTSGDGRAAHNPATASGDGRAALGLKWQQGYHDRLCLSREFIDATERYIAYNPLKWQLMYGTPSALTIHEPLDSPRLDSADYWKGVGNISLLSPEERLVSLRISRRLNAAQITDVVARISKAVDLGYIILSGFVSEGEKAVRDMLCSRNDARFIRILPSCIPNRRFKPESIYIDAFTENRYLEIARGNDEVAFDRNVCLDYNSEIIEIAKAGEGMALYFTSDGLQKM